MIHSLTGLRALAALLVFLFHASAVHHGGLVSYPAGFGSGFFRSGDFGVDIFFILSGFVISLSYADSFQSLDAKNFKRFIVFRVARLWPTHTITMLVMLMAYLVTTGYGKNQSTANSYAFEAQSIAASILMVHEWFAENNFVAQLRPFSDLLRSTGQIGSPNSVSWSISAEFLAYLCFPLIVVLTRRLGKWPLFIMMTLVGGVLGGAGLIPRDNLARVLYCFSLGVTLFHLRGSVSAYAHRFMPIPRQIWALTAGALVVGLFTGYRSANGGAPYLLALLATVVLIACICNSKDWLDRALAHKSVVYLGEISYAFYMIHWFVVKLCERAFQSHIQDGSPWLYFIMACELCVSGLMAAVLFKYIENPARQAIQRAYVRQHHS